jgi:hypothetical protein
MRLTRVVVAAASVAVLSVGALLVSAEFGGQSLTASRRAIDDNAHGIATRSAGGSPVAHPTLTKVARPTVTPVRTPITPPMSSGRPCQLFRGYLRWGSALGCRYTSALRAAMQF